MRRLIYSMGVSLDGFIAGPAGEIDWSAPDEELHRFHNRQAREAGAELYGRRLYEAMLPWGEPDRLPATDAASREFAAIWRDTPKLVFSRTLQRVADGFTLVSGDAVAQARRLKSLPGGDLAVGGAGLAAAFVEAGLVDEFRLFVAPVLLGGGTPYLPPLAARIQLRLLEERTFGSRVVYLRYEIR